MTYGTGSKSAKAFGDAHEYGQTDMPATNMDLHNNAVGREIGRIYASNKIEFQLKSSFNASSSYFGSYSGTASDMIFISKNNQKKQVFSESHAKKSR